MGKQQHQPWETVLSTKAVEVFDYRRLPLQYFHLVPSPSVQFMWSRVTVRGGGHVTTVMCVLCGHDYTYGGSVEVTAYQWAERHQCGDAILIEGIECVRLFR